MIFVILLPELLYMIRVFSLIFVFIYSCRNADKQNKKQLEEINKHTNILNDSVGQLIRLDSFNSKLKKEVSKDPTDTTGKRN